MSVFRVMESFWAWIVCGGLTLLFVCFCKCKVSSPHSNTNHYAEHVESGNFAFTAPEGGDYTACFWIPSSRMAPSTVTIEFEWRSGVTAKDWSKVAKKGQLEVSSVVLLFLGVAFRHVLLVFCYSYCILPLSVMCFIANSYVASPETGYWWCCIYNGKHAANGKHF